MQCATIPLAFSMVAMYTVRFDEGVMMEVEAAVSAEVSPSAGGGFNGVLPTHRDVIWKSHARQHSLDTRAQAGSSRHYVCSNNVL